MAYLSCAARLYKHWEELWWKQELQLLLPTLHRNICIQLRRKTTNNNNLNQCRCSIFCIYITKDMVNQKRMWLFFLFLIPLVSEKSILKFGDVTFFNRFHALKCLTHFYNHVCQTVLNWGNWHKIKMNYKSTGFQWFHNFCLCQCVHFFATYNQRYSAYLTSSDLSSLLAWQMW